MILFTQLLFVSFTYIEVHDYYHDAKTVKSFL